MEAGRGRAPPSRAAGSRAVSDDQILAAQRELARRDGVFVEPASAAGVAGLLQDLAAGESYAGQTVVVTVTGHGLKDTATALEGFGPIVDAVVDADVDRRGRGRRARLTVTTFVDGPVRVSVPATSANLGPGFDALGLALDLRDRLEAEVTARAAWWSRSTARAPTRCRSTRRHLVVRAMRAAFDEHRRRARRACGSPAST